MFSKRGWTCLNLSQHECVSTFKLAESSSCRARMRSREASPLVDAWRTPQKLSMLTTPSINAPVLCTCFSVPTLTRSSAQCSRPNTSAGACPSDYVQLMTGVPSCCGIDDLALSGPEKHFASGTTLRRCRAYLPTHRHDTPIVT